MSADNKEKSSVPGVNADKCSGILLDVAGTITSINFVKNTLFPYITGHVEEYLKAHWDEDTVKDAIKKLQTGDDALDNSTAAKLIKELTEQNSTNEGLKIIQGLIYKKGYENGDLKAHVFNDVPSALEHWSKTKRIAVFSTGSVDSQKLLFAHTTEGDLSNHISNFFDQSMGTKTESSTYEKICSELGFKPEEVIFLTDDVEEAKAAQKAGLISVLVTREGNPDLSEEARKEYPVISSFADLPLETVGKRKVSDELDGSEVPPTKVAKTDGAESDVKNVPTSSTENADNIPEKKKVEDEPMEVDNVETSEAEKKTIEDKVAAVDTIESDSKTASSKDKIGKEDNRNDQTDSKKTEDAMAVEEKTDTVTENKSEKSVEIKAALGDKVNAEQLTDDKKVENKVLGVKNDSVKNSDVGKEIAKGSAEQNEKQAEKEKNEKKIVKEKETVMKPESAPTVDETAKVEVSGMEVDEAKTEECTKDKKLIPSEDQKIGDVKEISSTTVVVPPVSDEAEKSKSDITENNATASKAKLEETKKDESVSSDSVTGGSKVENSETVAVKDTEAIEKTVEKETVAVDCADNKETNSDKLEDNKSETINDNNSKKNEEKENKSDAANVAECEKVNGEVTNGETEKNLKEAQSDKEEKETEVKVKQIETNSETTAVSVAV